MPQLQNPDMTDELIVMCKQASNLTIFSLPNDTLYIGKGKTKFFLEKVGVCL